MLKLVSEFGPVLHPVWRPEFKMSIELHPRMLVKEEVGEALMQSLRRDVDGAVYFIYPGLPLIEVPDSGGRPFEFVSALYAVGKLAMAFGKDTLSVRDVKILLFVLLYVGFFMLHKIIVLLLSFII